MDQTQRLRVCILCEFNPFSWVPHYVKAFRARCDVITVGPALSREKLAEWDMSLYESWLKPNDISIGHDATPDLRDVLPSEWEPHLVVGIAQADTAILRTAARYACPTALIAVDTWQCPDDYLFARQFDFVFAAQREFVPLLTSAGSRYVEWLPLACAPDVHHPVLRERDFDVSFVGSWKHRVHRRRAGLISALQKHFRVAAQDRIYGDDVCDIMCRGKLMFNHSAVEELNMRIFEAMCMGGPLLTNREAVYNGLLDLFEDGKHLIAYSDESDLIKKAQFYLDRSAERDAIARAGRDEVLAKHTYQHRVDRILDVVSHQVPDIAERATRATRFGVRLRDYLPTVPGAVVDVGLGLESSKYALNRLGVTSLNGIAFNRLMAQQRAGSYDAVFVWPELPRGQFDTVFATFDAQIPIPFAELFAAARAMLRDGGELVLAIEKGRLAPEGIEAHEGLVASILLKHDLCLTLWRDLKQIAPNDTRVVAIARRRSRTLLEVFLEPLERIPDHGVPLERVRAGIPPNL
jgi:hypothetical protein